MTSCRPSGHSSITIYLAVPSVPAIIPFYQAAFGAEELLRVPAADDVVYHAEVRISDHILALHEDLPGTARARPPQALGGTSATLTLWTDDLDTAVERAAAAGATVDSPAQQTYWGSRMARITDPAGHGWSLATHQRDVSAADQRHGARAHHLTRHPQLATGSKSSRPTAKAGAP